MGLATTHINTQNLFAVQLHDQTQHTVRGRVLRTKVNRKVAQTRITRRSLLTQQRLCVKALQVLDRGR